jgi:hypothetical protein
MNIWRKRAIIIAILITVGAAAGWLSWNLFLDFLLGGRTFR